MDAEWCRLEALERGNVDGVLEPGLYLFFLGSGAPDGEQVLGLIVTDYASRSEAIECVANGVWCAPERGFVWAKFDGLGDLAYKIQPALRDLREGSPSGDLPPAA